MCEGVCEAVCEGVCEDVCVYVYVCFVCVYMHVSVCACACAFTCHSDVITFKMELKPKSQVQKGLTLAVAITDVMTGFT